MAGNVICSLETVSGVNITALPLPPCRCLYLERDGDGEVLDTYNEPLVTIKEKIDTPFPREDNKPFRAILTDS